MSCILLPHAKEKLKCSSLGLGLSYFKLNCHSLSSAYLWKVIYGKTMPFYPRVNCWTVPYGCLVWEWPTYGAGGTDSLVYSMQHIGRKQSISSGRDCRIGSRKQSSTLVREPRAGNRKLSSRSGKGKVLGWHSRRMQANLRQTAKRFAPHWLCSCVI